MNRLLALKREGQSIWIDFIKRSLMTSGELHKLIEQDGVCGLTSNPAIFEKAIGGSAEYDGDLRAAITAGDADPAGLFEQVAIKDIRLAADALRPVYDSTRGQDGYVSLEVSPHLALDTAGTLADARRLWRAVDRPNLMIKVPGTKPGAKAIRQLIGEGINVNVTLLFSREQSRMVAEAYIDGVEAYAKKHGDASRLASVASFFVSRIDNEMDATITARIRQAVSANEKRALEDMLGKVAIANAWLAYADWRQTFGASKRWQALEAKFGAHPQRLLWASTGTKNAQYRDTLYIESLVAAQTVNTVPPATLDAYRDHGELLNVSADTAIAASIVAMAEVKRLKLPLGKITDKLLVDGIALFAEADDKLMAAVAKKRSAILGAKLPTQKLALGDSLTQAVQKTMQDWSRQGTLRRLWIRDSAVWTGGDEANWLAWLDCVARGHDALPALTALGADLRGGEFTAAVLIGMGGSSLGPEVLSRVFGGKPGMLPLLVLDSTDPAQIAACEAKLDITRTLFIVASKSGSTLEPDILMQYFLAKTKATIGSASSRHFGSHFIAITDPGSRLEAFACDNGFRHIVAGVPGIGGRYSVLSNFGLVPAVVMGVDVALLLADAGLMVNSCSASTPPQENPGFLLGAAMGAAALAGRDKLTLLASPALASFGAWVEQLIAESTGKHGRGIVPVDAEPLGASAAYGNDRLFVDLRLEGDSNPARDQAVAALAAAGHPLITIALSAREQIAQEFFHWEMATAVAGAVIGIHPFDQPDVEAAKIQTKDLMTAYERDNILPQPAPLLLDGNFALYGNVTHGAATLADAMKMLLGQFKRGDYFALLAYLEMNAGHQAVLQDMRKAVRDARKAATCLGFGPRFLHSTGQLYKGGPDSGVFLQITCDDAKDLPVPGRCYSFGTVKAAQALGDFSVLEARGRRTLRVHIKGDLKTGLATLQQTLVKACKSH